MQSFLLQLAEHLFPLPQLFSEIDGLGSGQAPTHRIPCFFGLP